jgi:hypothetical protein
VASPQHSAAIKVAQAHRTHDTERIDQARRELAELNITSAIQRNLAKAPPLSNEQKKRLTSLLRTGGTR